MSSAGASGPIDAFSEVDASLACRLKGSLYIAPDPQRPGREFLTCCGGGNWLEAWAEFRPVAFGSGARKMTVSASGQGRIILMTEREGRIGCAELSGANGGMAEAVLTRVPCGTQPVWLLFDGVNMDVRSFRFE